MQTNLNSIKTWAEDDRPREKLQLKGKASLSNAELIAILIGSGSRNESAVDLAKRILSFADDNLNALGRLGLKELTAFKGIGEAKAISIITALELGKRRSLSEALKRKKISSSKNAFEILHPVMMDLPHEEFWIIFLTNSNHVLSFKCISKGGLTGTMADVRMIFKEALNLKATGLILAHNHPSGSLKPSNPDKTLTRKLTEAGRIMDIPILDHLIITDSHYFSFADEGML